MSAMARVRQASEDAPQRQESIEQQRPKRRKITQACQQCRARKSRCDGTKPVCSECAQRPKQREPCRYSSNRPTDQNHDDYIASLLDRIHALESEVRTSRNAIPTATNTDLQFPTSPRASEDVIIPANTSGPCPPTGDADLPESNHAFEEVSPVDAMGANANVVRPEELDDRFYGSSSTVSFIQQVHRALGDDRLMSREDSPTRLSQIVHGTEALNHPWNDSMLDNMTLLPRPFMDRVLNVYWDKIHHLYPFVHRPTFMQAYDLLWTSDSAETQLVTSSIGMLGSKGYGPSSIIFHCALNSLLALAVQFVDLATSTRNKICQRLAEKSRNLCKLDLFDDGSLAMVQTLLLMAQYLQSTPYPTRCWNCIGISCRMAQGLGLHVEAPRAQKQLNSLEIEMCRRVWHGCVMLDTVVSMTLGRPMMLYKHESPPLPSQQADELTATSNPSEVRAPWIDFYVESIKVYKLLADVVSQFHGKTNGIQDHSDIDSSLEIILRIDSAMSKLEEAAPDYLQTTKQVRLPINTISTPIFAQQRSILQARCLFVRILLYRPIFTRYCQTLCAYDTVSSTASPTMDATKLSSIMVKSLSIACVEYSIKLIETVNRSVQLSTTGAWWYNLFYARNGSIVILLAMAFAPFAESVGSDKLDEAWKTCQELLNSLQSCSRTVNRCLRGLDRMHRHILRQRNWQRQRSQTDAVMPATEYRQNQTHDPAMQSTEIPTPISAENVDLGWLTEADAALFDEIFSLDFGQILIPPALG